VVSRSRWLSPAPCGQARRRCGAGSRAAPRARLPKRSERPTLEPMRIDDGGEPSADGRGLQARIGEVSEIGRRCRRARGERMRFRAFAPGLEILPIRSIRSPGRRGLFVGRVPCRRRREHQRCIVDAAGGKLGRRPVLRRPRARNSALYLHTAMCALNFGCGKSDYLR
jgi:hypothetical protein